MYSFPGCPFWKSETAHWSFNHQKILLSITALEKKCVCHLLLDVIIVFTRIFSCETSVLFETCLFIPRGYFWAIRSLTGIAYLTHNLMVFYWEKKSQDQGEGRKRHKNRWSGERWKENDETEKEKQERKSKSRRAERKGSLQAAVWELVANARAGWERGMQPIQGQVRKTPGSSTWLFDLIWILVNTQILRQAHIYMRI